MKINENFNKGQYFEKFVLSVLGQIASKSNKELFTEYNPILHSDNKLKENSIRTNDYFYKDLRFDAFAPNGIADIEGPVVIEIKYNPRAMDFKRITYDKYPTAKTLYIVSSDLKDNWRAKQAVEESEVIIWDNKTISKWEQEYPIDYYSFYTDTLPETEDFDFKNKIDFNLERLKSCFLKQNISFSLGAGVSRDYGIPNWNDLIDKFFYKLKSNLRIIDVDAVKKKIGNTSIINGQLVEENTDNFFKMLHGELYPTSITPDISNNTVLSLIAKIVVKLATARRFNVVTYNYDDNLEKILDTANLTYNIVYSDAQRINDALTIYHPHGYMPRENNALYRNDYKDSIVFSETAYYKMYNDPFNWSHILQQNIYRENTFLFFGCSISDPYLRRILDTTKNKNKTHFCFTRTDNLKKLDQLVVHRHFARMGVECIWFNNYTDYKNALIKLEAIL